MSQYTKEKCDGRVTWLSRWRLSGACEHNIVIDYEIELNLNLFSNRVLIKFFIYTEPAKGARRKNVKEGYNEMKKKK